jgi:hypothetical protein
MDTLSRSLRLKNKGTDVEVPVHIFWPYQESGSWFCRWEIRWPNRKRTNTAGGADAIQSLRHALEMVGAELYCSDEHEAGVLTSGSDWKGYGFPVPHNIRKRLVGDDKEYL